ncbi:MAG: YbaN family protein [Paludibacter sp.]
MKVLFVILGILSLILGIVGVFLPILPTTPFVLLSAYLFGRSSEKLNKWLLGNKYLGSIVHNYRVEKAIALHTKIISITFLWITMLYSGLVVLSDKIYLQLLLLVIAVTVTIHILRFKTKR